MFLSVFDIFKIGIGPSSSHTMGPMTAAGRFLVMLSELPKQPGAAAASEAITDTEGAAPINPARLARIQVSLRGSLAFTGKGHATDRAVILGLTAHPISLRSDSI